jgi:chloramphenicol 3-O-phosphotransferase
MKEVQQQVLMVAPVVEAAPAESRKFAINKYTDGNYGIYTNDFMLTDDTKEKLESMVPGLYRIQVKVLNVETDIEVIIETETEAYDFEKRGHEWFIGKTING